MDRVPAGIRAIAYDVRGRGETRGPEGDGSFRSLAADLDAFSLALGLERFALVGHSLGTAIVMQYALDHPESLRSLVAVSPVWVDGMPQAYVSDAHQERLAADHSYFEDALRAITPGAPRDELWERLMRASRAQSASTALGAQSALLDWSPGNVLGRITVPRSVIVGALDPLTTVAVARRAAEALAADLVVMEGVGHAPMLEAPDAFAELLWERVSSG